MAAEAKPAFINHAGMTAQEFFRINENAMDAEIIRRWHQGMAQLREEFCGTVERMEEKEKEIGKLQTCCAEMRKTIEKLREQMCSLWECADALAAVLAEKTGAQPILQLHQLEKNMGHALNKPGSMSTPKNVFFNSRI